MWAGVAAMARVNVRGCTPRCFSASLWVHHFRLPWPVRWTWTSSRTVANSVGFICSNASNTRSSLSPGMVFPHALLLQRGEGVGEPATTV